MIQKQTWKDEIRILITNEEHLGSVQISIPLYVSDIFGKADALIYSLFVDKNHRRNGVAQHLLQLAEQQAKLNAALAKDDFREKVGDYQYKLMKEQAQGMEMYLKSLTTRMKGHEY